MVLFAYASNMDVAEFSKAFPSAKKIDVARLPGYCFIFNKTANDQSSKANIMQSANVDDEVWGVLIELADNAWEGIIDPDANDDYKLEPVSCIDTGENIYQAEAFVAQPHALNTHLLPYDWYHDTILTHAKKAGLPDEYINKLSAMSFKTDPDAERRVKKLKKIKR